MRSIFLLIPFAADVALKIAARMNPDALGRFSFPTRFGTIGLAPSVNAVLAFSLPVPNAWIWPVGWAVVAVLVWHAWCAASRTRLAIAAIVLGAISNLVDRTFLGGVTDYLSFTDLFPAFNIADFLIVGGIVGWMRSTRERDTSAERSR